jgi:hypothetical protein
VLTITAAAALLTGAPRVVALPLVLLAVAYDSLAAPALRSDAQLRGAAYLGVSAALLAWTADLHPAGMLLLICLYPQCFAMLDPFARAASAAVAITVAGYAANAARQGWTHDAVIAAVITP